LDLGGIATRCKSRYIKRCKSHKDIWVNGLDNEGIKQRKEIPKKGNLMDRMNTAELAANQFRMTQTRDKLAKGPAAGNPHP